ncbi:MAG: cryptochrome/photolyase family protein [Snowella sp.]|nr:cryptochrome/photolyase family protein [Snowella sp.]
MSNGIWILGDQLWEKQAALARFQEHKTETPVIFIESLDYVRQRRYHAQKLVLVWSAMRHFAEELRTEGWPVNYCVTDVFQAPLLAWIEEHQITQLWIMTPTDLPFQKLIENLVLPCKIELIANNHFLWSKEDFEAWATKRKRLLLEDFYREGRKRFQILMDEKKPIGGQWNFDKDNRKPPKKLPKTPNALEFLPDQITESVLAKVQTLQTLTYGKLQPFRWAVTRSQALQVLEYFIRENLGYFGTYQDAMVTNEFTLWHSLISPYLNLGLLTPKEIIDRVEIAYFQQDIPLNNVEGFIRQILGWREYMQGLYHFLGEDYSQHNWFSHDHELPDFYWDGTKTEMNCLYQVLKQVEETGYAHHIQRLMILSNFALIMGVAPQAIEAWFHGVFIDAYDWVMQTNVLGMGQFADGGILASKPYASSANYIHKMSDYCGNCVYNQSDRVGEKACPFNYFYWDFLNRHYDKLKTSGRMNLMLGNLKRINESEMEEMQKLAKQWREKNIQKLML